MFGNFYRPVVTNGTGQTLAIGAVTVRANRVRRATNGQEEYEGSAATIFSNTATIAAAASDQPSFINNDSPKWEGGAIEFAVTAPASSNGDVVLRLQRSVDGTTADTEQLVELARLNFTTSGTKRVTVYV